MHIKRTGQRQCTITAPTSGLATALGIKLRAYAAGQYCTAQTVPTLRRKHRHFNPMDAFLGAHSPADVWTEMSVAT